MKRIAHLSHTDLDGISCLYLSRLAGLGVHDYTCSPAETATVLKGLIDEELFDEIIITDLNLKQDVLDVIMNCEKNIKFLYIDHHITDVEIPENDVFHEFIISSTIEDPIYKEVPTCGTELYFKWLLNNKEEFRVKFYGLKGNKLMVFVNAVKCYDTYLFKTDDCDNRIASISPRLNILFYEWNFDKSSSIYKSITAFYSYITNWINDGNTSNVYELTFDETADTTIYNKMTANNKLYKMKNSEVVKFSFPSHLPDINYMIGLVFTNKGTDVSGIGNYICDNNPDIDLCVIVRDNIIDYRTTKDDVNVRDFAVSILGTSGGHQKAAGSTFPKELIDELKINYFIAMTKFDTEELLDSSDITGDN